MKLRFLPLWDLEVVRDKKGCNDNAGMQEGKVYRCYSFAVDVIRKRVVDRSQNCEPTSKSGPSGMKGEIEKEENSQQVHVASRTIRNTYDTYFNGIPHIDG